MAEPSKVGRPERVPTPEEQARAVQCLLEGNYREIAAQMIPIDPAVFSRWMKRGKESNDPLDRFYQFRQAVLDAERMAEMEMVELVRKAAKGDARHAQWYLERKFPERWSANRIELRELKKRVEEIEKNAAAQPPQPKTGTTPPEPVADTPTVVESPLDPDE